jgi:hypothetical protein
VRWWATGAALVSTFPKVQGSLGAAVEVPRNGFRRRATLDPDDFSSGFAVWSGTSFAAPVVAATVTAALIAGAGRRPELRLDRGGPEAAQARVQDALAQVGGAA